MVAGPVKIDERPLTYEDLELLPEDGKRYELLQGELIVSPSPGRTHQLIVRRLFKLLDAAVEQTQSGEVVFAPYDVKFAPSDVAVPDLVYVRKTQESQFGERFFDGAPAFIIEVVSPTSGRIDRVRKAVLYIGSGVQEYWVVDPKRRQVQVYSQQTGAPNPMIAANGTLTSLVVPEFSVELPALFDIKVPKS